MKTTRIFMLAIAALFISSVAGANETLPDAIAEFCVMKLEGDIADRNESYNASDILKEGIPTRRIIGYLVGEKTSYLWYEHGGRGRHQHLVSFYNNHPDKVIKSYVFISTENKSINELVDDIEFLNSHVSRYGEL